MSSVSELQAKLADEEAACLEVIRERDGYVDVISRAHVALGGDGEWFASTAPESPPHSGDLCLDVPALAAEVVAERDQLRAERDRFREALGRLQEGIGSDDTAVWLAGLKFASDVWVELTSPDEAGDR